MRVDCQYSLTKRPTLQVAAPTVGLKLDAFPALPRKASAQIPRTYRNIVSVGMVALFTTILALSCPQTHAQSFSTGATTDCVQRVTNQSPSFSDHSVLNCVGLSAFACSMTPGGDTTVGMIECFKQELDYWEARLAAAYTKRREAAQKYDGEMANLNATVDSVTETLTAMQTAWHTYREASCRYEQSLWFGGTGGGPATMACYMHLTAQQSLRLEGWWEQ